MKKINEKELHSIFTALRNENKEVYNTLYEEYYKLVYGIAFSVLKNKEDSEDITNEVFTKIYKLEIEKLPISNEASWLYTVTRNECLLHLRKIKSNINIDEIYDIPSNSKEMEEIVDTQYYNKLISELNEEEKIIVSLKVLSNFTFSKISQILKIPIGTVQWKYYKAINSLKISISSLMGTVIAFILIIAGRDKFKKENYLKEENKQEKQINNYETSSSDEITKSNDSSKAQINMHDNKESYNENVVVNPFDSITEITSNINVFDTVCITAGITFFIIFIIFFKKYQQKLRRKSSKL